MSGWEAMEQGAPDPFFAEGRRVDPADTRECDGYPGLAAPGMTDLMVTPEAIDKALECCGDPGDCGTCGA